MLKRMLGLLRGELHKPLSAQEVSDLASAEAEDECAPIDASMEELHLELGEVVERSERSAMAVSHSLADIVGQAEGFIDEIRGQLGKLEGDESSSVSAIVEGLCSLVFGFISENSESVALQREAAERMASMSAMVSEATKATVQISVSSRILCLNTRVEAARLGDAGRPLDVIAERMLELSNEIKKMNEEVSRSMDELMPTLADVASRAQSIEQTATVFSSDFKEQADEVGAAAEQIRQVASTGLGGGDSRLEAIITSSNSAIENLQSQDLVAQRINRVIERLGGSVDSSCKVIEAFPTYLSDTLGDPNARDLDEGDVMMF